MMWRFKLKIASEEEYWNLNAILKFPANLYDSHNNNQSYCWIL